MGLTIERLAELSDLSTNYVGSIETGHRDPSLSTIVSLARGLGVPVGELFGVKDVSEGALEAARLFERVPDDVQVAVIQLMRAVSRRKR